MWHAAAKLVPEPKRLKDLSDEQFQDCSFSAHSYLERKISRHGFADARCGVRICEREEDREDIEEFSWKSWYRKRERERERDKERKREREREKEREREREIER